LGKAAYGCDQPVALEGSSFSESPTLDQFSQSRCACHGGHTTLGLESDFRNPPSLDLQSQTKHIPARGVLNLRRRVSSRNFAGVARILEVIEQSRGVHTEIVNG
jgi:hypothetical protein